MTKEGKDVIITQKLPSDNHYFSSYVQNKYLKVNFVHCLKTSEECLRKTQKVTKIDPSV